jgi:hypothetical protein
VEFVYLHWLVLYAGAVKGIIILILDSHDSNVKNIKSESSFLPITQLQKSLRDFSYPDPETRKSQESASKVPSRTFNDD